MAINRIKTGGITDATIKSEDIAPGTIASDRLAGGITNTQLAGSIANAKLANSAITINGTSIALGASGEIVAGTDWQAVTVADGSTALTAEAGKGYFLDTNAGVIEVFLPASPTRGDTFVFADYGGNFATNKVIINAGTNLINSQDAADGASKFQFELSTNRTIAELVYVDSTKGYLVKQNNQPSNLDTPTAVGGGYDSPSFISATGGTITTDGDFKIHQFTADGNFVVSGGGGDLGIAGYLIVAGGGGGGRDDGGGGGGGGFRCGPGALCARHITFQTGTYPITVGAGGAAGAPGNPDNPYASKGGDSIVSTITSAGGGAAGGGNSDHNPIMNGGSGGGAGFVNEPSSGNTLGQGNTPPVSPPQGNNGGGGFGHHNTGGGGGGAGQAASNSSSQHQASAGGNGATAIPIFGCAPKPYYVSGSPGPDATFGGGGGGGALGSGASGGSGGGGQGRAQPSPTGVGTNGQTNKGAGGGGGANHPGPRCGGAGGSGIVLLKYRFQD